MTAELGYSESDLKDDLRKWWQEQVTPADDPFSDPSPPKAGTIFDVVPEVDSLGVVTALITIEKHIGFEVPTSMIKAGGYHSFEDMVNHLLPKVSVLVAKRRKEAA